jgi:Complex 1 protein (LYR family)
MSLASGSSRKELLILYRRLLRSAATYPSMKRESIYQAIREDWRENATLTQEESIRRQISVAYKGLSQLRQFDEMTMTGGAAGSPNWNVTLEQNPMPKPADYDDKKKKRTQK